MLNWTRNDLKWEFFLIWINRKWYSIVNLGWNIIGRLSCIIKCSLLYSFDNGKINGTIYTIFSWIYVSSFKKINATITESFWTRFKCSFSNDSKITVRCFFLFNVIKLFRFFFFFRKSLVNKDIERAVAAVQTVIGLGRVVRERKVVPMKVN